MLSSSQLSLFLFDKINGIKSIRIPRNEKEGDFESWTILSFPSSICPIFVTECRRVTTTRLLLATLGSGNESTLTRGRAFARSFFSPVHFSRIRACGHEQSRTKNKVGVPGSSHTPPSTASRCAIRSLVNLRSRATL